MEDVIFQGSLGKNVQEIYTIFASFFVISMASLVAQW